VSPAALDAASRMLETVLKRTAWLWRIVAAGMEGLRGAISRRLLSCGPPSPLRGYGGQPSPVTA
jgi:hypothetical protein